MSCSAIRTSVRMNVCSSFQRELTSTTSPTTIARFAATSSSSPWRISVVALVGSTLVFKGLKTAEDLLAANTVQLGTASVALLPVAILLEGAPHFPPTAEFVLNLAYLILVMSLGATFLWFWLLRHGEASRVSAFYFLTPIFGLGLGALLLGEPVRPLDGLGLAAVAAGIILVQSSRGRAVPAAVEET